MSEHKPNGHSGQGTVAKPEKRPDGDSPKPHGDTLQHAVDEAAKSDKSRG